jgi:hypothetical protein
VLTSDGEAGPRRFSLDIALAAGDCTITRFPFATQLTSNAEM